MSRRPLATAVCLAWMSCIVIAQAPLSVTHQDQATFTPAQTKPNDAADISGMYTFLKEGEFVQLTLDDGQLSGFISRFGDTETDKGEFIDQFFDKASVQGNHVLFKTKSVHAVWYEFDGIVTTAAGKQKGEEGNRVLNGKLTMHKSDATGHDQSSERAVEFKSFPDVAHMKG